MAVGQNQWYHFGVGEFTTHFRTYSSGDWDVYWGCGVLTHGQMNRNETKELEAEHQLPTFNVTSGGGVPVRLNRMVLQMLC